MAAYDRLYHTFDRRNCLSGDFSEANSAGSLRDLGLSRDEVKMEILEE